MTYISFIPSHIINGSKKKVKPEEVQPKSQRYAIDDGFA